MVYNVFSMKGRVMITIIHNTHYGYQTYNIDNLWNGLYQMGCVNAYEEAN